MLVVGSANSSNTARLVEVARREGCRAELIEDAVAARAGLARNGVRTIGLTAGASAPDVLVQEVLDTLSSLGPVRLSEERSHRRNRPFRSPNPGALMPIPLRQNLRIGAHLVRHRIEEDQVLPVHRRDRAAVRVQPVLPGLRQDPAPDRDSAPAPVRRGRRQRRRGERHADGVDRRRRAACSTPTSPDGRKSSSSARSTSTCARTRSCSAPPRPLHAVALLLVGHPHGRHCRSATTPPSTATASSTKRSRRSGRRRPGASG